MLAIRRSLNTGARVLVLAAAFSAMLLCPSFAGAYSDEVNQCIDSYTFTDQPRLARNALSTACLCSYDPGISRCSQWTTERIKCVVKNMPKALDNNDARQINTYCKRKAGLRYN